MSIDRAVKEWEEKNHVLSLSCTNEADYMELFSRERVS